MCYSLEVSLGSGLLSYLLCYLILQRKLTIKEKKNIYFLLIFSSMQFSDTLLWYSGMKRNNLNFYTTSIFIPFVLSLQILFNIFIINKLYNPIIIMMVVIAIIYLFYRFNGYSKPLCSNNFSSPVWANNEIKLCEIILFATFILYPRWKVFLLTMILILLIKIFINGAIGSWWCFISIFISIYYYITYGK